jgi:hypothetical protein
VRWTIRSSSKANFETSVDITRRQGHVTVDALDRNGGFINFLEIKGSVASPSMKSLPLRMEQNAPGRYEGAFDASEVGQYIISLSHKDADGTLHLHTTGAVVPYSPEYRELRANQALLTRLSDLSGGEVHPFVRNEERGTRNEIDQSSPHSSFLVPRSSADLFRHGGRTRTAPQDLWPLLLLAAALLFPVDVGIRRLMLSPEEILGHARRGIGWTRERIPRRAPAPERERALSRLLSAKERAEQGAAVGAEEAGVSESARRGAAAPSPGPVGPTPAADARREPEAGDEAPDTRRPTPAAPRVVWGRRPPGIDPASPASAVADAGGTPPAAETPGAQPPPGGSHTGRLLDAKRRAREKPEEKPPEGQ